MANVSIPSGKVSTRKQNLEYTDGTSLVAKNASATVVSFTPSTTKKNVSSIKVSAVGYAQWHLKYGTTGLETDFFVFYTNPSNQTEEIDVSIDVSPTETLLVIGSNLNTASGSMALYSTIEHEVQ
jgi:penicillin V acylase-like amidase (Ntn superfamily)